MRHPGRALVALVSVAALACSAAPPGENVGTVSSAITFANDQPAFDYFVGKGLTPFQAAGIVGNLDQESGVDPTAVQGGGPGRGIAQWSVGGRWDTDTNDNTTWYATQQGEPLLSLQLQLDFIWYELTHFSEYGLADLHATTNVSDATIAFETDFEGCGTCDQSTRIAYAQNVLTAFGGTVDGGIDPDASTPSGADAGTTACTVTATGESGECIDTATCAAMTGFVSTPGFCPGPEDIQCCTHSADASTPSGGNGDGGTSDAAAGKADAAMPGEPADAGKTDTGSSGTAKQDAGADDAGGASTHLKPTASSGGGCAVGPGSGGGLDGEGWLVAVGLCVAARRRVRTRDGARGARRRRRRS